MRTMKRGDRGPDVKALQEALNDVGYVLGSDGIFGAITEKVVKMYQDDVAITIDGIVGPQTQLQLGLIKETDIPSPVQPVLQSPSTTLPTIPIASLLNWKTIGIGAAVIAAYFIWFRNNDE